MWNAANPNAPSNKKKKSKKSCKDKETTSLARSRNSYDIKNSPSPLHTALGTSNLNDAWQILNNGTSAESVIDSKTGDNEMHLLLRICSSSGIIWDIFQLLMAQGVNHSLENNAGQTPLLICLYNRDYVRFKWLIRVGAQYEQQNKKGVSALKYILMKGDSQALAELPTGYTSYLSESEIYELATTAIMHGHDNMIKYAFTVLGIDINNNEFGHTLIEHAALLLAKHKKNQDSLLETLKVLTAHKRLNCAGVGNSISILARYKPSTDPQRRAMVHLFKALFRVCPGVFRVSKRKRRMDDSDTNFEIALQCRKDMGYAL